MNFKNKIRSIDDWPKKGIVFRDITPVLADQKYFRALINQLAKPHLNKKLDIVVGIDARGFLLASAVAYKLGTGLAIVRKHGKLPYKVINKEYTLEYATETLEMHVDAIKPGQRVLIVDDVLATGGTMKATINMVRKLGGKITCILLFIELKKLNGRKQIKGYKVHSLVKY